MPGFNTGTAKTSMRLVVAVLGFVLACWMSAGVAVSGEMPPPLASDTTRPGAPGPTRVGMGIWIADVSRIDSAEQTFVANLVLVMSWRDPLLAHRQEGDVRYALRDIWHPNWLIANATTSLQTTFPDIVSVAQDGLVTYRQRVIGTFSQALNLQRFPFDQANFLIHFVVVGQTPAQIEFVSHETFVEQGLPQAVGIAKKISVQDWQISNLSAGATAYEIVPGTQAAGYAVTFKAERRVQHYVAKVIVPLLLIVIMSWAAFWLEPEMGASQVSIAVTSMLTLIAYRSAIGAETPRLPYLTDLDAFILVSSVLVLLTLIEVIVTSSLVSRKQNALARRIDWHSRYVFPVGYIAVTSATLLR